MTFDADLLADGQVTDSEGVIYTAGASQRAMIKTVSLHNTSATPQTVVLYARPASGTSRILFRWVLAQHERGVFAESIALNDGDSLRAETTTASVVDYLVFGVVQS